MAGGGYIYIIHVREFMNAGQNVFKIGRTIDIHKRFKQYPKGSQLIYTCLVDHDILRTERAVMKSLKHHCIQRKDIGTEYFEADRDCIIKLVGLVVDTPRPPPVKIKNGQAFYNIENVVSHYPCRATSHASTTHYVIKWSGYPSSENTKEPACNIFKDMPCVVRDYWVGVVAGDVTGDITKAESNVPQLRRSQRIALKTHI
jgi:hypothetical protein